MWVKNEKLIKVYENDIVNGTVRIPSSINKIADLAFFGLDNLTSIIIPVNIRYVETGAFSSCVNLVSVKFDNPYCHIECGCFKDCENLKELELPRKLKILPNKCLYGCIALSKLTLPQTLEIIEPMALGYVGLKEITIPNCVKEINSIQFIGCHDLIIMYQGEISTMEKLEK